jgi:hypothetical protein
MNMVASTERAVATATAPLAIPAIAPVLSSEPELLGRSIDN